MAFIKDASIEEIRQEVDRLIALHSLDRKERIYSLSQFFDPGEWELVECEIESNGYSLMTNSMDDLLNTNRIRE